MMKKKQNKKKKSEICEIAKKFNELSYELLDKAERYAALCSNDRSGLYNCMSDREIDELIDTQFYNPEIIEQAARYLQ